jgi:uncharacterized repeat protein (TIGR01451 family)
MRRGSALARLCCLTFLALTLVAGAQAAARERVDLVVRVTGPGSAQVGQAVEYTVRVGVRTGRAQSGVRLTAALPRTLAGVRFVAASGRYDPKSGVWRGLQLRRGASLVLRVRASVSRTAQAGPTRVVVRVAPRAGVVEIATRDNTSVATTQVRRPVARADVRVAVDDGRTEAARGSSGTYVVTVANAGPDPVQAARVRLTLPSSLENVGFTPPSAGIYDPASATWSSIDLPPGGSASLRLSATLNGDLGTDTRVTASVAGLAGASDPNPANDEATDVTLVVAPIAPAPSPGPPPVPGPPPPPAPA